MKWKLAPVCAVLLFFASVFILYPERYVPLCFNGVKLWAECVLPSLFPFMVVTMIFIRTGVAERAAKPFSGVCKRLKLPDVAAVLFFMSICSGYPAGSRMVAEYYDGGWIDAKDAKKLSVLCSTSGPLFIIGSVGFKMFSDKTAGAKILLAHVLAVLSVSALYFLLSRPTEHRPKPIPRQSGNILYDCFYSSVVAVVVAGGFICFFYTLAGVLTDFRLLFPLQYALTNAFGADCAGAVSYGLIEATGGCAALAACGGLALPLAGFLITFGGLSILMQQLCYLLKCGVPPLFFVSVKCLQGGVCFLILLALCAI